MKFLKFYRYLFESVNPFSYKLIRSERNVDAYEFITNFGMDYDVKMIRDKNVLFVSYSVEGHSQNAVINKGDAYRVFSTIIEIIKDQLALYKNLDTIGYDPLSSFSGDTRREKIYESIIKKNFDVIDIKTKNRGDGFVSKLIKIR